MNDAQVSYRLRLISSFLASSPRRSLVAWTRRGPCLFWPDSTWLHSEQIYIIGPYVVIYLAHATQSVHSSTIYSWLLSSPEICCNFLRFLTSIMFLTFENLKNMELSEILQFCTQLRSLELVQVLDFSSPVKSLELSRFLICSCLPNHLLELYILYSVSA